MTRRHYVQLLESCIQSKSLTLGKQIHQAIIKDNTHFNNFTVLENLTHLYARCDQVLYARRVFDKISNPRVILWNIMIRAYAWNGPFEEAIDLYHRMLFSGIKPTNYTYPFVLKACSSLQAVEDGMDIHDHVKLHGLESDVYICTALVDFYAKCGNLVEAKRVFDSMMDKDVVAWNAMIAGLSLHGLYDDTLRVVIQMQETRISPNSSTLVAILPAVAQANALSQGKAIHGYCLRRGFDGDFVVETGLLDMYGKCQCQLYGQRIFNMMGFKNEVTWSAMIGACLSWGDPKGALELFHHMFLTGTVNASPVTFGSILRACAELTDVGKGRQIHCHVIKLGCFLDLMLGNTLISMYAKCGSVSDAIRFFDEMICKDTVSYSAVISGCVQNGNAEEALDIFHQMQLSGVDPDSATMVGILPAFAHLAALQHGRCGHSYLIVHGLATEISCCNALIDMYAKCGRIDVARKVFNRMAKRDIITWNALIAGYGMHGLGTEALSLFHDFLSLNLMPDDVTFISLLSACSHSGLVAEGKCLFHAMTRDFNITPRLEHYICMVDLLGRAGHLDEAWHMIQKMPFEPDVQAYGALLAACRVHKNIEMGEEASKRIQSLGPEGTGNFVLLSNLYSIASRWDDAADIRIKQRDEGLKKSPGCSWVEINGVVHAFVGGDCSHPEFVKIHRKLEELLNEMKKLGYGAESSFVFQDVEEEEKEQVLLHHSEKLAIAFALLSSPTGKHIFVTKNLRVCGDCHSAIKFIAKISNREITLRDAVRFHHFKDGVCNCGDFW